MSLNSYLISIHGRVPWGDFSLSDIDDEKNEILYTVVHPEKGVTTIYKNENTCKKDIE